MTERQIHAVRQALIDHVCSGIDDAVRNALVADLDGEAWAAGDPVGAYYGTVNDIESVLATAREAELSAIASMKKEVDSG